MFDDELALDFDLVAAAWCGRYEKPGIAHAARLHEIGFGDADLGVGRLQARVVHQRDLHCGVGRQGPCRKRTPHGLAYFPGLAVVARPARRNAGAFLDSRLDGVESRVRGETDAAAEEEECGCRQELSGVLVCSELHYCS